MKKLILLALTLFLAQFEAKAQCDSIADICHKNNFTLNYISDGQNYRVFLSEDQEAEFTTMLFAGAQYRMAACSGFTQGSLIFKIKDELGNILFDSGEFANAPYWDFKIKNTVNATVTAQLDPHEAQSGCATLLIGFKK